MSLFLHERSSERDRERERESIRNQYGVYDAGLLRESQGDAGWDSPNVVELCGFGLVEGHVHYVQ